MNLRGYMRLIQKVLNLTQKEEPSGTFLSWRHITISYKTKKIWITFSSFIKMGNVLPQQKYSDRMSFSSWVLERFDWSLYHKG